MATEAIVCLGRSWKKLLIFSSVALALFMNPSTLFAQSDNPAPNWFAPYCEDQPLITSIYDNNTPMYKSDANTDTVLYTGMNVKPCGLGYDGHDGWDYLRKRRNEEGDPAEKQGCFNGPAIKLMNPIVFAAEKGVVRRSRWYNSDHEDGAYGLFLDINREWEEQTLAHLYGHLAAVFVEEGTEVFKGQPIGAVGNTGNSSAAHLHFMGAKGERGDVSENSFDIYGWNKNFGSGYTYPGFAQPFKGDDWPMRVVTPGEEGPDCPTYCDDDETIEDDDGEPDVVYSCVVGGQPRTGLENCSQWQASGNGHDGGSHFTAMSGTNSATASVRFTCNSCWYGTYILWAHIPAQKNIRSSEVARYEAEGRVTIVDQHTEGNIWQPIGVFRYPIGTRPYINILNRGDRYDFTDPDSHNLNVDAIRFRKTCGGFVDQQITFMGSPTPTSGPTSTPTPTHTPPSSFPTPTRTPTPGGNGGGPG